MLRIVVFLFLNVLSINAFATAQAPDYLIYEGEKYPLHANPLEGLFLKKKGLRPVTDIISSGNWRGYVATFEINERALSVSDITISKPDPDKEHSYLSESVLLTVFPNEADRRMDWFSGLLIIPLGKQIEYVHLSYASHYESYLLIRIENGLVEESTKMDLEEYKGFKERQFEVFKTTPEYHARIKDLSTMSRPGESYDLEGFIFEMGEFTSSVDIPFRSQNELSQATSTASADKGVRR